MKPQEGKQQRKTLKGANNKRLNKDESEESDYDEYIIH